MPSGNMLEGSGGAVSKSKKAKQPKNPTPIQSSFGKQTTTAPLKPGTSYGNQSGYTKPAAVSSAPIVQRNAAATPSYSQNYSSGGGGYSGGGGDMGALAAVTAPPQISDDDWIAQGGDSTYQMQLAALAKALADSNADYDSQETKYDVNYNDSLKGLGWMNGQNGGAGSWNFDDLNTAAGRGMHNLDNDYASRGMLQSSAYGDAVTDFNRSLTDQLNSINTGRSDFRSDIERQRQSGTSDNQQQIQQARADAIARRAATISLS